MNFWVDNVFFKAGDGYFAQDSLTSPAPIVEYLSSQVAEAMGLHAVHYDMAERDDVLYGTCSSFLGEGEEFVTLQSIAPKTHTSHLDPTGIQAYRDLGEDAYQHFLSMHVFDLVIDNPDRYGFNAGFIKGTDGSLRVAPIFDNGSSSFGGQFIPVGMMVADVKKNEATVDNTMIPQIVAHAKRVLEARRQKRLEAIAVLAGPLQVQQLSRLRDFEFVGHPLLDNPPSQSYGRLLPNQLERAGEFVRAQAQVVANAIQQPKAC